MSRSLRPVVDPSPAALRPEQSRVLVAILVLGVFQIASLVAGLAAIQLGLYGPDAAPVQKSGQVEVAILRLGFAALAVFGCAWFVRPDVGFRPRGTGLALGVYFAVLPVWAALSVVAYPWLLRQLQTPLEMQLPLEYWRLEPHLTLGPWIVALGTCIVGPLAEELVFRGYVQGSLRPFLGARGAILGSALLFGLMHGWHYALPIGLLGVLFGWLRERTGTLWAPFVAHAVHNGVTLATAVAFPQLIDWIYRR